VSIQLEEIEHTKYFNEVSIRPEVKVHIPEISVNVIAIPTTNDTTDKLIDNSSVIYHRTDNRCDSSHP